MYRLEVSTTFSAAHALRFGTPVQVVEPVHGHDFHVTVTLEGPRLDGDGLLVDFHLVEQGLQALVAPFRSKHLNEVPPFDRTNPSAEQIARHIGDGLASWLETQAREHPNYGAAADRPPVRVLSVRVTEAVGCAAIYLPEG
jgi:6-pyruvoyltetrahydropterin/6-carboxytetrahydropterin synthase